jgi:hypothetical protein
MIRHMTVVIKTSYLLCDIFYKNPKTLFCIFITKTCGDICMSEVFRMWEMRGKFVYLVCVVFVKKTRWKIWNSQTEITKSTEWCIVLTPFWLNQSHLWETSYFGQLSRDRTLWWQPRADQPMHETLESAWYSRSFHEPQFQHSFD